MNDLQLSILLQKYADLLRCEIEQIGRDCPAESFPDLWEDRKPLFGNSISECILLDGLYALLHNIEGDVELLRRDTTT